MHKEERGGSQEFTDLLFKELRLTHPGRWQKRTLRYLKKRCGHRFSKEGAVCQAREEYHEGEEKESCGKSLGESKTDDTSFFASGITSPGAGGLSFYSYQLIIKSFTVTSVSYFFEVLNHFGDDLGVLKVPLNYVYDTTLRLHSAGYDAMSLFSDKDNLTLMFLISSRLKQVLKSPQISVIQKVIVGEALVRLNTFLESVVPVVDIKSIAFKCIGESDEVVRDSIQREIMRSFDFAATPKQIQEILLHVKEEQEIILRIKQRPPLSLSVIHSCFPRHCQC